ncbi:TonB-dependent receptor [Algoriphagus sp.]|uniref:TonB-dependent receptor domain-containing protein n=1 Tax=Algoriphagus sp. TaxID=1872435 RepID=UPI00261255D1|nr:TonB-dependent receptor [Algoriphagus sp.]
MKKRLLILSIFFPITSIFWAQAQESPSSITGRVLDNQTLPIPFANVALYTASDSNLVKVGFTDDVGKFILPGLEAGSYWLKISFVGYQSYTSDKFDLGSNLELPWKEVRLENLEEILDEVVVQGEIPILEVKQGQVIFNVAQSITTVGISTLELLRKTPNVLIDNAGNIRLLGRTGATVAINGKILPLTGADLTAYLQTIQTDQIESIALITEPGAQFDAVGTSGVINIVLKKNSDLGSNGSFSSGYSIGNKSRYNTSLSGNYRNNLLNVFGSYSYNRYQNPYDEDFLTQQKDLIIDLVAQGDLALSRHAFQTGVDVNLSPKSVIGFLANGSFLDGSLEIADQATIASSSGVEGLLRAESNNLVARTDLSFNLNYRFQNENGTFFNLDADYAYFDNSLNNRQPNQIFDPTGSTILTENFYVTNAPTIIDIKSIKADTEFALGPGNLSLGMKFTDIQSDNEFEFFRDEEGNLMLDTERSNDFSYAENVTAAYTSYRINWGEKYKLVTGLRAEHTQTKGNLQSQQSLENALFERNYLNFFPSVSFSYLPNEKHDWSFGANRRINRPNYKNLNPFQVLLNEFYLEQGNPNLLPEYATTVTIGHTYHATVTSSLTYNQITNLFGDLYLPLDNDRSIGTFVNLDKQTQLTLNISAPLTVSEWWEVYGTVTGFYVQNKFDTLNTSFDAEMTAMSLSLQNTFSLPKSWNIELSGFYNSPTLLGVYKTGTSWTVDVGAQKSILNDRGSVTLGVSDIFKTNYLPQLVSSSLITVDQRRIEDTRRFMVSFSYHFGNSKLKASRSRDTGVDEEKSRTN